MATLNYAQYLDMLGPYYIAPGEPASLGWYYPTSEHVSSFPSLQTGVEQNIAFTIESTTVWVVGDGPDVPPTSTNYAILVTNNAPTDAEGMVEVFVVLLSAYY
jgi:hypothetical protein